MRVRPERARRGVVNVVFAMMFFAILGLASLVIDLGVVRQAQRAMQSAADSAAVEGLREGVPVGDAGRGQAAGWTAGAFADADLNGRVIVNGAGPTFELSGGIGPPGLNASQLLRTGAPYKPVLQPNPGNAAEGDLVVGTFVPTAFGGFAENADYTRNDGFSAAAGGDALLVRLRRTDPTRDPLAWQTDSQTSSSGPPLPLLFGRGTTIAASDPAAGYNPRVHGFAVRATAIAQATPVRTVGPPLPAAGVEGMTPFALRLSTWQGMTDAWMTLAATTGTDGPAARVIDNAKGTPIGRSATGTALALQVVNETATVPAASNDALVLVYVPVFDTVPGVAGDWIIGFGVVRVSGSPPYYFVGKRKGGLTFPADGGYRSGERLRNVSATVVQAAETALDPAAPLAQVFRANEALHRDPTTKRPNAATGGDIPLSPALVR